MPSIHLRPGKPTAYLDTSTLSYAFRGGHEAFRNPKEPQAFRDLFRLVERISRQSNLCISTMHIVELAHGREDAVRAMFSWLDSLDLVWMYSYDKVQAREDENALQRVVGAEPHAPVDPFAPSMLAAFARSRLDLLDSLSEAITSSSPILALAEAARMRGRKAEHGLIRRMVRRFYYDRHLDPTTLRMSADEKQSVVERKRREELERASRSAWEELRKLDLPDFHAKYRRHPNPEGAFADFVFANPTALPSFYVSERFATSLVEVMGNRKPGGKGAEQLTSAFYDFAHASIGAAYCDVFTCDSDAAKWLGDAPERIGRERPIVFAGNEQRILEAVRELERRCFP